MKLIKEVEEALQDANVLKRRTHIINAIQMEIDLEKKAREFYQMKVDKITDQLCTAEDQLGEVEHTLGELETAMDSVNNTLSVPYTTDDTIEQGN